MTGGLRGTFVLLLLGLLSLGGCGPSVPDLPERIDAYGLEVETSRLQPTLRLFTFPEYLDPDLIRLFRQTYGVRVIQDYFDTNETMLARVRAGGASQFDLIMASDYAVEQMVAAGELDPLLPSLLPNRGHLHPQFVGLPYDPDHRYAVPYQWGTTGLGLRGDRIAGDAARLATWATIFEPDGGPLGRPLRFALLDDPRETIGAALLYLGHSVNSTDDEALAQAEDLLIRARDRALTFTPASTGRDLLVAGEVELSHNHSGEIASARREGSDIVYLTPREGTILWTDNLVVPRGSAGSYTAHVFMNFLLDPEIGARLTNEIRYLSPNASAWPLLDADLRRDMEQILGEGDFERSRLQLIRDVGEDRRKFDRIWTRVRAGATSGRSRPE